MTSTHNMKPSLNFANKRTSSFSIESLLNESKFSKYHVTEGTISGVNSPLNEANKQITKSENVFHPFLFAHLSPKNNDNNKVCNEKEDVTELEGAIPEKHIGQKGKINFKKRKVGEEKAGSSEEDEHNSSGTTEASTTEACNTLGLFQPLSCAIDLNPNFRRLYLDQKMLILEKYQQVQPRKQQPHSHLQQLHHQHLHHLQVHLQQQQQRKQQQQQQHLHNQQRQPMQTLHQRHLIESNKLLHHNQVLLSINSPSKVTNPPSIISSDNVTKSHEVTYVVSSNRNNYNHSSLFSSKNKISTNRSYEEEEEEEDDDEEANDNETRADRTCGKDSRVETTEDHQRHNDKSRREKGVTSFTLVSTSQLNRNRFNDSQAKESSLTAKCGETNVNNLLNKQEDDENLKDGRVAFDQSKDNCGSTDKRVNDEKDNPDISIDQIENRLNSPANNKNIIAKNQRDNDTLGYRNTDNRNGSNNGPANHALIKPETIKTEGEAIKMTISSHQTHQIPFKATHHSFPRPMMSHIPPFPLPNNPIYRLPQTQSPLRKFQQSHSVFQSMHPFALPPSFSQHSVAPLPPHLHGHLPFDTHPRPDVPYLTWLINRQNGFINNRFGVSGNILFRFMLQTIVL